MGNLGELGQDQGVELPGVGAAAGCVVPVRLPVEIFPGIVQMIANTYRSFDFYSLNLIHLMGRSCPGGTAAGAIADIDACYLSRIFSA